MLCAQVVRYRAGRHHARFFLTNLSENCTMPSLCSFLTPAPSSLFNRKALVRMALPAILTLGAAASYAADTPLMQGANTIITNADVLKNIQHMPVQVREEILSDPAKLRQLISNLHLRRAFAQEGERKGLAKTAEVQFKLDTARESILAEAQVEHIATAATPDTAAADKLAQTIYKAEPERFAVPAQTRARHILIKGTEPSSLAQAEKLLAELKAGANFEDLAKANSADPGSAVKGGDLGFFPKGHMTKPFEDALETLKQPGDLSGVVQSDFGYHVIRLEERQPASTKPFEEVREQLRAEVTGKAQQEARMKEVKRLQDQAKGDETALAAFIAEQKKQLPAAAAASAAK